MPHFPDCVRRARSLLFCLGAIGCEASFDDLRPDLGLRVDVDAEVPAADAGFGADLGAQPTEPITLATGTWAGRSDYRATGTVSLVFDPSGRHRLLLSSDFSASGVPGPIVVLSRRDALGNRLDPAQDIELGTLRSNSGAQSYDVPPGGDDRMWAWIFCKPFGVEVARARLEVMP